ncbi:MAG: hypothetical protein KF862_23825 [Chitinophagaceae bacterium]|nr:hypothetical protein [Chitinophagaceae bacterium]
MRYYFFSVLLICLFNNFCFGQKKNGYLIVIDRSHAKVVDGFNDITFVDVFYIDSLNFFSDSIFIKHYSNFISKFLLINNGFVVTNNPTKTKGECTNFNFEGIPKDAPFKTLKIAFGDFSSGTRCCIYKINASFCEVLDKSGLSYWYPSFVKRNRFLRLDTRSICYQEVDQNFIDKLKEQLDNFTFGYEFFDVGMANFY